MVIAFAGAPDAVFAPPGDAGDGEPPVVEQADNASAAHSIAEAPAAMGRNFIIKSFL